MKNFTKKLFTLGIIFTLIIGMVGCSKPQKKKEVVLTNTQEQEKTIYDLNGIQSYEEIDSNAIVEIKKSMAQDENVFVKQMFNTLADVIELLPEGVKTLQLSVFASNISTDDDFLIFSCTIPEDGLNNIRKEKLTSIEGLSKNCEQLYIDEIVSEEAVKNVIWPGAEGSIVYKAPEEKTYESEESTIIQSQTSSTQDFEYNVRCADCGTSLAFTDFAIKAPNGTWYCVFCGEDRGYSYDDIY